MFRGMNYVLEVYHAGSVSKAAANMYISQPSLSANIKRIEDKIGYPLFDRSTKPLELTEFGKKYVETAQRIIAIENEFVSYINDVGDLKLGSIHLGGSSFFSSWVLPPLISDFSKKYPDLSISLTEAKSAELTTQLQNTQLDFIIDNKELDNSIFDREILFSEELLLAVPAMYPENRKLKKYQLQYESIIDGSFKNINHPSVPLSAFEGCPFIVLHKENDTGRRADIICREQDFHPNIALILDQQLTSYTVASSGNGIAFIGEVLISKVPHNPNLIYYRIGTPSCTRNISLYWKRERYISHAMTVFRKFVVDFH